MSQERKKNINTNYCKKKKQYIYFFLESLAYKKLSTDWQTDRPDGYGVSRRFAPQSGLCNVRTCVRLLWLNRIWVKINVVDNGYSELSDLTRTLNLSWWLAENRSICNSSSLELKRIRTFNLTRLNKDQVFLEVF